MKNHKWLGLVLVSLLAASPAGADTRRDHRSRTCDVPMKPGVRFTGDLGGLSPACRAQAEKINAQVAEADDKSNDDDDDDDDRKTESVARSIEAQKRAADAAFKAAREDVLEARDALKAAVGDAKKQAEQDVKEAEATYNQKLDEAAAVAKKITDKAQRSIKATIAKQKAEVGKIEDKLRAAAGKAKLELEGDLIEEKKELLEKERLLVKSNFVEAAQQAKLTAKKLGTEFKSARDTAVARLERAKDDLDRVETKVKASVDKLEDRAHALEKELNAKLKREIRTVKTKAATIKKKFKDLEKDVSGSVAKVKNVTNEVKDQIHDLFDF